MTFTPSPEYDFDSGLTPQDLWRYICYDDNRGGYWVHMPGRWTFFSQKGAILQLTTSYCSDKKQAAAAMRKAEQHPVTHAFPVGGFPKGIIEDGDSRILVTVGPNFIEPCPGDCSGVTARLLDIFGESQREIFYAWVKISLDMFREREWMPAPVLVLAGPANCGKGWLISFIRMLFGGRPPGLPFENYSRNTSFNCDVMGKELLIVENETYSDRVLDRRALGMRLRGCATNMYRRMEQKYHNPLSMFSLNRCVVTIADDPDSLTTMPILDEDLRDKILLMKLRNLKLGRIIANAKDRAEFEKEWVEELPAFIDFLDTWQIPSHLIADRTGLKSFQDQTLRSDINAASPLAVILDLIDLAIPPNLASPIMWKGKASELFRLLCNEDDPHIADQARRNVQNVTNLGRQLASLAYQKPDRVIGLMGHGSSKTWTIYNPKNAVGMTSPAQRLLERINKDKVVDIKAHQK
jgi:hypothetical protein